MSSLTRMLGVLKLITPESPTLDPEQVSATLGCGISTSYRYIRELVNAGLLVRLPAGYSLGPRVIQLDLQMRQTDPLLHHGRGLLTELVAQTGLSALLSELYEDMVITLHEEAAKDIGELEFGRGRSMPLHRGATGRIILAHLPPRQLRRAYDRLASEPRVGIRLPDRKQFSREMQTLRKQGYCLTYGEVEAGRAGIAAPIFDEAHRVLGSVTLVGDDSRLEMFNEPFLAKLVCDAAASLTQRIELPTQKEPGRLAVPSKTNHERKTTAEKRKKAGSTQPAH